MGLKNPPARAAYKKEWDRKWAEIHGGRSYCKQWAIDHPEAMLAKQKRHYARVKFDPQVRARYRKKFTQNRRELKLAAFVAYGGPKCACCGESELEFLCLDHIKNDGNVHRKQIGGHMGMRFYYWLRRHGWPQGIGLQVLCYNCNNGKRVNNGVCPHQEVK